MNFTTTEHVVYDGNDIAALDNLTINGPLTNNTFTYDASLLKGSFFSSFLSPEFESLRTARITVNGGPSNDVVNLIGSAGGDTVTSAGNAITFITPGSAAIITLGANIDSLAVQHLGRVDMLISGSTGTDYDHCPWRRGRRHADWLTASRLDLWWRWQ